jgi:23S rRNA (pseudouridine1915-N3)-methyltransferase
VRLTIAAVGRMKTGPERDLSERYLDRLKKSGGALGLDYAGTKEWPESRAQTAPERKREEAALFRAALPDRSVLVCFDETGRSLSSEAFAAEISGRLENGARDMVFCIGGPDGFDESLRDEAALVLSFGRMTFPHQIARILLAEQLYRAATILAGHPYHRA